ncbi:MAG: twin-arginine translocase subunit TatC [bacterium]|nr:twin-arginine translocase subunit TatC [bacterium]MDT8396129.1 twin-arginine translocase subunit TatC [bacterium]
MSENRLPFTVHLEELRKRLIVSAIAVGVGFLVCYAFKDRIFEFVAIPLIASLPENNSWMIFTGVTEAFFTYLKVSLLAGVFLSLPILFYQFWAFIAPGLHAQERRTVVPFVIFSTLFFITGASFGYFVVFPFGFKFLLGFATDVIRPFPSLKEYLSFATKLLLAFGFVFEMPLITYFLARIGLLTHQMLTKNRRYFIVVAFIGAAVLTPPDVVTQLFMAGPLIILFEISVVVARIFGRKPLTDTSGELTDEEEPGSTAD